MNTRKLLSVDDRIVKLETELKTTYVGLDELVHYRHNCWCARSWCSGSAVDAVRTHS